MRQFEKNDSGFMCSNCGSEVKPLVKSSRNHCTNCLHSLHVDIYPGDRLNTCGGLMRPIGLEINPKKGYVIVYQCEKCKYVGKNKSAHDDNFSEILKISATDDPHKF